MLFQKCDCGVRVGLGPRLGVALAGATRSSLNKMMPRSRNSYGTERSLGTRFEARGQRLHIAPQEPQEHVLHVLLVPVSLY